MNGSRQYVLLPRTGVRAVEADSLAALESVPSVASVAQQVDYPMAAAGGRMVRVIDTIGETKPKLVELDDAAVEATNAPGSPLRALPIVTYGHPNPPLSASGAAPAAAAATSVTVECRDAVSGDPIAGARVVAFTNFVARTGDQGVADVTGDVDLTLSGSNIERLYVFAKGYWGALQYAVPITGLITVPVTAVDLSYTDAVRHYYGSSTFDPNAGVVVGIIDSGVGPHTDLNIIDGRNTVTGESATDWADPDGHGTHVAGLVGSNGVPPTGLRGVAPGVGLRAYRVFPASGAGATSYAILKAMIKAADDGCDIINLSLGGGPYDWIVDEAIRDAREQGMLVIAAAGNDERQPVNYPAAYTDALAVSAMGREGTFPAGSAYQASVLRPPASATNPLEFIADFSNVGSEIAITGLGVAVLSTLPGNDFGPMSGTSMAAPVVAGCAAALLSHNPSVHGMPRNRSRSNSIQQMLLTQSSARGFGALFEGYGLPDPAIV